MAKKNFRKISMGLALIVIAIVSVLFAFYHLEVKPELASRNDNNVKKLTIEEVSNSSSQNESIPLNTIVEEARKNSSENVADAKEGFLWVDAKSAKYVVTLGAVQGLLPGNYLTVYNGDRRVGQVTVETALDIISYVQPIDESVDLSSNKYFRVTVE